MRKWTSREQGAAAATRRWSQTPATSARAYGKVLGGQTLRAGPLKDVRRMEWRRWCAVVRRQRWEHGGATWRPRGCSFIKAANGRIPAEAGCEPKHDQHSPAVPHGHRKARKTNTNPFLQKLDAARRCDANPREENYVRIADLNVLYRHQ